MHIYIVVEIKSVFKILLVEEKVGKFTLPFLKFVISCYVCYHVFLFHVSENILLL